MKRIIVLMAFVLSVGFTQAQQITSENYIGAFLGFGSEVENPSVGGIGEFFFSEKISFSPSLILYWPRSSSSFSELNGNMNFYLTKGETLEFYGMGGLNVSSLSRSDFYFDSFDVELGLNLGAGININTSSAFKPFFDIRYVVSSYDQVVVGAGLKFNL
ncbi:MAG: hypothetical protein ACQESK_03625 [Bacteroidota bacterium]